MPLHTRPTLFVLALSACAAGPDPVPPLTALPTLPESAFAEDEAVLSPEDLREDLDALYRGLRSAHYDLFARRPEAEYEALYREMRESLDRPLRVTEAAVLFQRFAAFGNVAHARIDAEMEAWRRYREAGGTALPVYPRIRDGRLFVAESYAGGIEPGDEIVAIEGAPAGVWLDRLGRNISADNAYIEATLLELSFPSSLWLELGEVAGLALTVRGAEGTERVVTAETIDADTLSARAAAAEERFFALDSSGRKAEVLEGGIAYLQPGPFYGVESAEAMWDPEAFGGFIDESFTFFLSEGASALVIDLRQNPGGDNSFSDLMISWFADEPFRFASEFLVRSSPQSEASNRARIEAYPQAAEGVSGPFAEAYAETPYGETFPFEIPFSRPRQGARFEGPVFAIVDRYSYSNATNVAALLQDYGFATILGEETSDLATSYGAMEHFTLPNSGLEVGYPKALIVRPSGARTDRGVVPDVVIESPVFSESDVVLDRAIEIVRERTGD